jgi:predicted Zn-dependent protease
MRALALLLSVLLALPGCTTNPVSGDSELLLMSEQTEQRLGDEAARQVEAQLGFVDDEELTSYVEALGKRLASYSPRQDVEYSFHVVEMEEPNAFALPGGYIYVSRGLLALANSEAELAGVLAHEIGHVAARHAAQRDTRIKVVTLLTLLGIAAAAAGGDGSGVGATQLLGQGLIAAYSRSQESQSDRIALELTSKAGIDPAGMANFLRALDYTTRLQTGASRRAGFFDSHPSTPERLAEATTRAQVLHWTPDFSFAVSRAAFLQKLDALVVGPAAREGVFRENHFLHADLGFALRFPHGWNTFNTRAQVIAVAPSRDAIAMLELQGPGADPRAAAVEYSAVQGVSYHNAAPILIGSLPAFRARARMPSPAGLVDAMITWIAFDGQIYRLAAGSLSGSFPKYQGIFRSFARGFRPLRDEDRQDIGELRLRVVHALGGETLSELSERTDNGWDLNETAVFNSLFAGEPLVAGQPVKIARREIYTPPAEPVAEPESSDRGPLIGPRPPPVDRSER